MSNVMSMKNVRNSVHRSSFDLSRKNAFTTIAGALTPCFVQEVLPGDSFEFDVSNFTRTSPVNTAAFVRMKENVDFFFVPYSLLWDKWEQFIAQTDDPHYAASLGSPASLFSSTPYCKLGSIAHLFRDFMKGPGSSPISFAYVPGGTSFREGFQRLLECLGYGGIVSLVSELDPDKPGDIPVEFADMAISPFRFAAYQKIYYDHYRDSQWESSKPQNYNFDYVLRDSDTLINFYSDPNYSVPSSTTNLLYDNMFTLRFANYRKDKFMGLLPSPQFGDVAIAGPVLGNLSVYVRSGNDGTPINAGGVQNTVSRSGSSGSFVFPLTAVNNTSGISVLAMRLAEATQKYREITLTGSKDYRDQIFKHWNAKVPSYASTVCERLFSYDSSLDISEVVNSNIQQGTDADIAGKGVSAGRGKFRWKNTDGQYGIIMGIYHCEPLLDYSPGLSCDRQVFSVTPDSFPQPEFDSIGMEEVFKRDLIMTSQGVSPLTVQGYAPRYYQWKTAVDQVSCGFNHKSAYGAWVSALSKDSFRTTLDYSEYSYLSKKVIPQLLNSIFVAQVDLEGSSKDGLVMSFDTDQFLVNMFISCKCARNLSSDGLPY